MSNSVTPPLCIVLLLLTSWAPSAQNPRAARSERCSGPWAGGSGWKGVYDVLVKDGYNVSHMPDAGENEADDGSRFPSDLNKSGAIKRTADGFTYLDPTQFHEYFAADLSAEQAAFTVRSQVFNFADNFRAVITIAAWRSKAG